MRKLSIIIAAFSFSLTAAAQTKIVVQENDTLLEHVEGAAMVGTSSSGGLQATLQGMYYLNKVNEGFFLGSEIGTEGISIGGGYSLPGPKNTKISPYLTAGVLNEDLNLGVRVSRNLNNGSRGFIDGGKTISGGSYLRGGLSIPLSRASRQ